MPRSGKMEAGFRVTPQQSTIVLMSGPRLRKMQFRESAVTHRHGERLVPRHESRSAWVLSAVAGFLSEQVF
jgi:hypothetical protein